MKYRPKKMKCDRDTARELIKVFGKGIVNDLKIMEREIDREELDDE
jgi:hypothetical protein